MKKCENCEKMILTGAIRCPYCGALQKKTELKEAEKLKEQNESEKPKEKVDEENKNSHKTEEHVKEEKRKSERSEEQVESGKKEPESSETQTETENSSKMTPNYCSNCGAKLERDIRYCTICGTKVGSGGKTPEKVFSGESDRIREIAGNFKEEVLKNPERIRKIVCVVAGIFYLCSILKNYGGSTPGLFLSMVCIWNAFILYRIGFQCSEKNGKNLMYGLLAGCAIEVILFIVKIGQTYYYTVSTVEYLEFLRPFIVAGLSYYLMQKEGYLQDFLDVRKEAVEKYREKTAALKLNHTEKKESSENVSEEETFPAEEKAETKKQETCFNAGQTRLHQIVTGKNFLAFCIVFTAELLYQLFSELSFFSWMGKILSIFLCVCIWQIWMEGRKNSLKTPAFENVSLIMTIKYVIKIIAGIFVCFFGLLGGPLGFLATLVMTIVDICYIGSIRKTTKSVQRLAEGADEKIRISFYPMLVLGVNVLMKMFSFFKALAMISTVNYTYGLINNYGNAATSGIMSFLQEFGINQGSGIVSYLIQLLLMPFQNWIQGLFGGYENPLILLLGLAVPVCELLVMRKLRLWRKEVEK